jgi:thymidylate synthase
MQPRRDVNDYHARSTKRTQFAEMQRSKCEFHGQTQAKAEAQLNEWKKANARAVSIIAQIVEKLSTDSDACVIRVEYENGE